MRLIRYVLGKLVLLFDRLTSPKSPTRNPALQSRVNDSVKGLSLYQFEACPFCVKVRRELKRLGLTLELRDAQAGPFREELAREGGQVQVPCLRIPGTVSGEKPGAASGEKDQWLYESDQIIAWLRERVAKATN